MVSARHRRRGFHRGSHPLDGALLLRREGHPSGAKRLAQPVVPGPGDRMVSGCLWRRQAALAGSSSLPLADTSMSPSRPSLPPLGSTASSSARKQSTRHSPARRWAGSRPRSILPSRRTRAGEATTVVSLPQELSVRDQSGPGRLSRTCTCTDRFRSRPGSSASPAGGACQEGPGARPVRIPTPGAR